MYCTTTLTLQAVSANALSDQQMTLPQDSPHQVTRAAADLHNLPWYGHLLPNRAFRIMMVDATPKPHLLECKKKKNYVHKLKFIRVPRNSYTLYSFVRTEKLIDYKSMRCCWTLYASMERTGFWPFPAERPPTVPNTLWVPLWSPIHHKWCH